MTKYVLKAVACISPWWWWRHVVTCGGGVDGGAGGGTLAWQWYVVVVHQGGDAVLDHLKNDVSSGCYSA